jgi:hypothetical protein
MVSHSGVEIENIQLLAEQTPKGRGAYKVLIYLFDLQMRNRSIDCDYFLHNRFLKAN